MGLFLLHNFVQPLRIEAFSLVDPTVNFKSVDELQDKETGGDKRRIHNSLVE